MTKSVDPRSCEQCGSKRSTTLSTRRHSDGALGFIYRRKKCENCGERWTTYETRLPVLIQRRIMALFHALKKL